MRYRDILIRAVTFVGGLYFFLEYVLPEDIAGFRFGAYHQQITTGFIAVGALAFGLGLINILMVHGGRIAFVRTGWGYSVALLMGLLTMFGVTCYDWWLSSRMAGEAQRLFNLGKFSAQIVDDHQKSRGGVPPLAVRRAALERAVGEELPALHRKSEAILARYPQSVKTEEVNAALAAADAALAGLRSLPQEEFPQEQLGALGAALRELGSAYRDILNVEYEQSTGRRLYGLLFDGLFVALGSSMFSLLGFYIASAAYRAFRIRSAESLLMTLAALVVMLGQIPFGVWLWEKLPALRLWLLEVPNSAAFRGITFGAAIAALIMAFRMWLSIESSTFVQNTFQGSKEPRRNG